MKRTTGVHEEDEAVSQYVVKKEKGESLPKYEFEIRQLELRGCNVEPSFDFVLSVRRSVEGEDGAIVEARLVLRTTVFFVLQHLQTVAVSG
jgi:hypothetical protein